MSDRIKRTNDELKADRPSIEEVANIPRLPISILVENFVRFLRFICTLD